MPSTTSCPFCGAALKERTAFLFGRAVFAGFEECQCAGAIAERVTKARDERIQAEREQEERVMAAIRKAGIAPRYERAEHPMAQELAQAVMQGRNAYVFGEVGTLKTLLASAAATALIRQGCSGVVFSAMWKVLDEIRASFHDGSNPLPRYQTAKVLFLDDLGKESPTGFALERLFALVDERNAQMLPTVVTTQYKGSRLIERLALNGDADTAKAIVSRLRQDCLVIQTDGGDRRRL